MIPVRNAEQSLPILMADLVATFTPEGEFEIILVNDGSVDRSWPMILELRAQFPQILGLDLMFNTGQFRALMCGLEYAHGKIVVTMDDDLQHPAREALKLVRTLAADPMTDAVIGYSRHRDVRWYRRMGSRLNALLLRRSLGTPTDLRFGSFRAIRLPIVEAMLQFRTINPVPGPLLFRSSRRIRNVEVELDPRWHGASNYGPYKLGKITLDNLLNYSTMPLKVVGSAGLLAALVGAGYGVMILIRRLLRPEQAIVGWTSLALLIVFFSGLMLLSMWLIGEYLIRILMEVGRTPRHIVRSRTE